MSKTAFDKDPQSRTSQTRISRAGMADPAIARKAAEENFPVGSVLVSPRLRPHIALFYAFARTIDDIADDSALDAEDKIRRLEAHAAAIEGQAHEPGTETAVALRESLIETGVPARHCLDLISAFKQDAVKRRYRNWDDLVDYCNRSAAPVGRYLLDLHGEERRVYPASDALSNALQVINHLQDCKADYLTLDRVYVPLDWLEAEGLGVTVLAGERTPPALRRVFDRTLDMTEEVLTGAQDLPRLIRDRRLALEAGVILRLAWRLVHKLRRGDPLARRVALGKTEVTIAALTGLWNGLSRPKA